MYRMNSIKTACYLNFICLFVIIIFNIVNLKSNFTSSLLIVNSTILHSINSSFRDKLINERLTSYSHTYDNECNTTRSLNDDQVVAFGKISKKLATLRTQIISYPNEYFHGRGIVLTTGLGQLRFAKVNLKMIELTGTRLPVQVLSIILSDAVSVNFSLNFQEHLSEKSNLLFCSI
jgi:hypothetical protein